MSLQFQNGINFFFTFSLSYEGDHLPTDAQIQNGLFALQNYRKGATAGQ